MKRQAPMPEAPGPDGLPDWEAERIRLRGEAARGLVLGAMFRRDGTRVASVAQEALIRRRRDA